MPFLIKFIVHPAISAQLRRRKPRDACAGAGSDLVANPSPVEWRGLAEKCEAKAEPVPGAFPFESEQMDSPRRH